MNTMNKVWRDHLRTVKPKPNYWRDSWDCIVYFLAAWGVICILQDLTEKI